MKLTTLFSVFAISMFSAYAQTTVWSENFNNACASGCLASAFSGTNGAWSVSNTGTNGAQANQWFISGAECGMMPGDCGTGCGTTNSSLHIGSNLAGFLVDPGAAYLSGGGGLLDATTNRRAESPVINTTGFQNLTISFNYIEFGQATLDNAQLWLFDGATWALLTDMPKTLCCGGVPCDGNLQGLWDDFTFNLPASCNNNPNVRIGFLWVNNNDDLGSDPSVAIDDVVIEGTAIGGGGTPPTASFVFQPASACIGQDIVFTDTSIDNAGSTYEWNFGPNATPMTANTPGPHTVTFNAVGTQTVTLTLTDPDGNSSASQDITITPGPTIVASPDVQICEGGSATISATGANAYTWDNGLGLGSSQLVSPTVTTTYTVTGVDVNGCSGTDQVTVTVQGTGPTLETSSIPAVCPGTSTGSATVVATGSGPFTYQWTPVGGNNPTASNLFPGVYSIAVTDAAGCTSNAQVTVNAPEPIQANADITDSDCNLANGSILLNPSGGNGSYSYAWTGLGTTSPALSNLEAGNYQAVITDGNSCSATFNFVVGVNDDFIVSVTPATESIAYLESVALNTLVVPNQPNLSYVWTPPTGLSCSNCPNPVASPSATTIYTVTVTAPNGCVQSGQAIITVDQPCGNVFMPTIFSPNGDFKHDRLCVLGPCIEFVTYTIYNRWGEEVFTSRNIDECWNGTFRGGPAQAGIYAFKFQATLTDGTIVEESGTLTLVR